MGGWGIYPEKVAQSADNGVPVFMIMFFFVLACILSFYLGWNLRGQRGGGSHRHGGGGGRGGDDDDPPPLIPPGPEHGKGLLPWITKEDQDWLGNLGIRDGQDHRVREMIENLSLNPLPGPPTLEDFQAAIDALEERDRF